LWPCRPAPPRSSRRWAWPCLLANGGCEGSCEEFDGAPRCVCPAGKKLGPDGRGCLPPCDGAPCDQHCVPYGESFRCMCAEGYQLGPDGSTCQDVDDCVKIPEVCEQVCHNTEGGFECRCYRGYEMVEGHCMPVPNCSTGPCDHMCEDVPGSYRCICKGQLEGDSFVWHPPGPLCPNTCTYNNGGCQQLCLGAPGQPSYCACHPGYVLGPDTASCLPEDACHPNPCQGACQPRPGGFECICEAGYVLAPDGLHCEDVDECLEGPCKHECHNTAGSFYCSCQPGYQTFLPHLSLSPAKKREDTSPSGFVLLGSSKRWSCWLTEKREHSQQCCILIVPMQASTFHPSSKEAAHGLHSFEGYISFLKILLILLYT
uniref:EGF-like domain-containing protein n=1 Tax=Meleagris gallopavo TaxID=9103 RepID=A0A803XTD0_MELGA